MFGCNSLDSLKHHKAPACSLLGPGICLSLWLQQPLIHSLLVSGQSSETRHIKYTCGLTTPPNCVKPIGIIDREAILPAPSKAAMCRLCQVFQIFRTCSKLIMTDWRRGGGGQRKQKALNTSDGFLWSISFLKLSVVIWRCYQIIAHRQHVTEPSYSCDKHKLFSKLYYIYLTC